MVRLATRWESLFLIGLAAAVSAPAAAQYGPPPTPQPMPQPPSSSQATPAAPAAPATRADVLRAAACVAGRDAAAADALLATSPFSADERERAVRLLRVAQR